MKHSINRKGLGKYLPSALGIVIAAGFLPVDDASAQVDLDDKNSRNNSITPVNSASQSLFARTSILWNNPQWQAFKMLWRKLDEVTSIDTDHAPILLNAEDAGRFRNELDVAFRELKEVSEEIGIDSVELALLENLTFNRFDFLYYGSTLTLTRMALPPVSEQTDNLLPQIEARIDTVIKLRESGLITSKEMVRAFGNMTSCIDTYCVLEVLNRSLIYTSPAWLTRWPEDVPEIQVAFDSIRTASLIRIEKDGEVYEGQYQETFDAFKRIENALHRTIPRLPALNDLLLDLELI
jgi:hypothetical protein